MIVSRSEGVEENKEDDVVVQPPPVSTPRISKSEENDEQERQHGFQAQVEHLAQSIFGSCGTAIEAASIFVQGQACSRWTTEPESVNRQQNSKPPLSIAEELRKLAQQEGRPFPEPPPVGPRAAGIPRFLGEDAVQSFEDDNISAISAHTLEEMVERNGVMHPTSQRILRHQERRRSQKLQEEKSLNQEQRPPSPTRTISNSTGSSKERGGADIAAALDV